MSGELGGDIYLCMRGEWLADGVALAAAQDEVVLLRAEVMRLRGAISDLLNNVNARYPAKPPHEWECSYMAALDRLVNETEENDERRTEKTEKARAAVST